MRAPRNPQPPDRPAAYLPPPEEPEYPVPEPASSLSLMQILAIARHYWLVELSVWLVLTAAIAAALLALPKVYTATATLIVDDSNDTALSGQGPRTDQLGSYLAQQTELITSPVLLEPVVAQLHLTEREDFTRGFTGNLSGLPDYVAHRLSNALQVQISPNAQLLYVSASAVDPNEAAEIANAVVNQYFVQGEGREQQYATQLGELRTRVAQAQANLAAFRAQSGVTDLSDPNNSGGDTETQALTSLEAKLLDAQNQRRTLEAEASGDTASSAPALASPQVQQLETQLRTLQTERAQLLTIYGARHPKIVALDTQIAATRVALSNTLHQIRTDLDAQLARASDLEAQYQQAVKAQQTQVVKLRDVQGQGARLELELQSAQSVYKDALAGYEQTMFGSVNKFTNLRLISAAMPPIDPTRSKKRQWSAMGTMAALALAFALPFGYELLLNRRLRCRDDLERAFGVRVLALIGPIPPPDRP
ncbi:MAG TPA: Wzz/FepE/Etk N-terminal domain-containing protein [Steroidobacteraceae bacterium]|nr:Wzz/FepE/Etk N-terminal domain-containing protein [Steroidobacteraceae bacterium]